MYGRLFPSSSSSQVSGLLPLSATAVSHVGGIGKRMRLPHDNTNASLTGQHTRFQTTKCAMSHAAFYRPARSDSNWPGRPLRRKAS